MRLLLLLFFILFHISFSTAQISFPSPDQQPVWNMSVSSFLTPDAMPFSITYGNDTLMCGEIWTSIFQLDTIGMPLPFQGQLGFVRQDGQKVFVRASPDCNDPAFLMYDFSAEVGDTLDIGLRIPGGSIQFVPMVIGVVDSMEYEGIMRKTMLAAYLNDPIGAGLRNWVEGVGAKEHPFYVLVEINGFAEEFYEFHCLETVDGLIYKLGEDNGFCNNNSPGVKYVNQNVLGGNNDGTSWANAYIDLQDALSSAQPGDSIWVAQGIYFPTSGTDRTISFVLSNGVALYGGFNGTETLFSERDFNNNITELNGDIGILYDSTDNSYHIVYTIGTDSTTILDGFTVTKGEAVHPVFSNPYNHGGGIYIGVDDDNKIAGPIITNCIFLNNTAKKGGAIFIAGEEDKRTNPKIIDCSFILNKAAGDGGAIYNEGSFLNMAPFKMENCIFNDNYAWTGGGAVYLNDTPNGNIFISCHFKNNTTQVDGGAIYYYSQTNSGALAINNCVFEDNTGSEGGAICFFYVGFVPNGSIMHEVKIDDSKFLHNNAKTSSGGGIAFLTNGDHGSNIEITKTEFIENQSLDGGGAIYILNGSDVFSQINMWVNECVFIDNISVLGNDGGLYYQGFGGLQKYFDGEIANSLFIGNNGAVTMITGFNNAAIDGSIKNCTFYNNGLIPIQKNYEQGFNDTTFYNNLEIANCIIQEYTPIHFLFYNNDPNDFTINGYNIHHCIVNAPDCIVNGVDACGEGVQYEMDPLFLDALNGDLRLAACSPAINAGDNSAIGTLGILYDLAGNERIQETQVDMGAYERPSFHVSSIAASPESCEEGEDGTVTVETTGNLPYQYLWENNSGMGMSNEGLSSGSYLFTVTDAYGCVDTFSVEIGRVVAMSLISTVVNASAFGIADGLIAIGAIEGGTSPYQVLWENGDTLLFRDSLIAGEYTVTITDAVGCTYEEAFMVSAPDGLFEQVGSTISLFLSPNPAMAGGRVKVWLKDTPMKIIDLSIYKTTGELMVENIVEQPGKEELILPFLPAGVYIVVAALKGGKIDRAKLIVL